MDHCRVKPILWIPHIVLFKPFDLWSRQESIFNSQITKLRLWALHSLAQLSIQKTEEPRYESCPMRPSKLLWQFGPHNSRMVQSECCPWEWQLVKCRIIQPKAPPLTLVKMLMMAMDKDKEYSRKKTERNYKSFCLLNISMGYCHAQHPEFTQYNTTAPMNSRKSPMFTKVHSLHSQLYAVAPLKHG